MIINTLNTLVVQVFNGVTASLGNLIVSEGKEKVYEVFKKIDFLCHWIYGELAVGMICVINQFINLWTFAELRHGSCFDNKFLYFGSSPNSYHNKKCWWFVCK